ncbi:MAG: hypothetical protein J6J43_02845 [Oscillospiraceae bacterium]|nr:hypothetical protein [Oscillospiraceae bacterium]
MINVDISNVWTCVSLPDLLGSEQEVFDAHLRLRDNTPEGPDHMGWLNMPGTASGRMIYGIREAAKRICGNSDILVVCGSGGTYLGAKAAVKALGNETDTRLLFVGQSLSSAEFLELGRVLQNKDYSLFIISADGAAMATNIAVRSLRWMMERKYGAQAKERICVATMVGTQMHTMAQEEGYTLFPLPKQLGGASSALTSAAFVPMAVAGIDPLAVLEGAAESHWELDIRAFENPAWIYAGIRHALMKQGRNRELLCLTDPGLQASGYWLQRMAWQRQVDVSVETVLLPGDLDAMDAMATDPRSRAFETLLHFAGETRRVPVEMDWKDYDGLGFLSGKTVEDVERGMVQALISVHNDAGVPILDVDAGTLTAENYGAMVYFFELANALNSVMNDHDPFAPFGGTVAQTAMRLLGGAC